MSEEKNKTLSVGKTLSLKKTDQRQSQGTIAVEVKRRRPLSGQGGHQQNLLKKNSYSKDSSDRTTSTEFESRLKVLKEAQKNQAFENEERIKKEKELDKFREEQRRSYQKDNVKKEAEEKKEEAKESSQGSEVAKHKKESIIDPVPDIPVDKGVKERRDHKHGLPQKDRAKDLLDDESESITYRADAVKKKTVAEVAPKRTVTVNVPPKKFSKQQLNRVLDDNFEEKERSLAVVKRHRQKVLKQAFQPMETKQIVRDVIIPDSIAVGELASRMAIRSAEVIKALMKLGILANVNQMIDADTAEIICTEFGHTPKRVHENAFEDDLRGQEDAAETLQMRAPVVTVMGHVDHGKTSLLDAFRKSNVVSGEAGGITQHIGAYQITTQSGKKITFIDTPGHAAFSEMRSRGANVTDIVILVVAADDGIMEQTVEAINHAKAAGVPIIVAINKMDKPDANPGKVKQELMSHEILLEEFGGEVMSVEVSAKEGTNLDKLEEVILLQAEMQELKANPKRNAQGVIIESRVDKGRGVIATTLIQRGTLNVGDIFVAGTEWGKVRALIDDHGQKITHVYPSMPVELIGFNGVPLAGDEFIVVKDESEARDTTEKRMIKKRTEANKAVVVSSMEQMMGQIAAGERKELSVVIKADVHGSLEAIKMALTKLATDEVSVQILHGGVGAINESDISLASASAAVVLGFNVRANPQAKKLALSEGLDIRYYSIIYQLIDDMKAVMGGLLAPEIREDYIGQAQVRVIFNVPKVGKAAGCMVKEGIIKRGSKVRLLRDNVVIHEGMLKFLRRFKDEVKEVKEGYECGISFENYQDLKEGDMIECFEVKEIARSL